MPVLAPLRDQLLGLDQGSDREVLKNSCLEKGLTSGIPPQLRELSLNGAIAGEHLRYGGCITRLTENVP